MIEVPLVGNMFGVTLVGNNWIDVTHVANNMFGVTCRQQHD